MRQCKAWAQYDEQLNDIKVIHTRNTDLADDIFDEGETKPVKAKKGKTSAAKSGVKRSASQVEGLNATSDSKRKQPSFG